MNYFIKNAQGMPTHLSEGLKQKNINVPKKDNDFKEGDGSKEGYKSQIFAKNNIKDMQKAIQDFINTISITDSNRKDFNDFIAENYAAQSTVAEGQEWTKNPKATTKQSKLPTDIIELSNIFDNMKRIGSGKTENMIDGVWDFRTNNAVIDMILIAEALVNLQHDFGDEIPEIPGITFTSSDLQKLIANKPAEDPSKYDQFQLNTSAKNITPLINKLKTSYKYYNKAIFRQPSYTRYIHGQIPLFNTPISTISAKYDPGKIPEKFKNLSDSYDKLFLHNVVLPGKKGDVKFDEIPLSALQNKKSLQQFILEHPFILGYDKTDIANPIILKNILDALQKHQSKMEEEIASSKYDAELKMKEKRKIQEKEYQDYMKNKSDFQKTKQQNINIDKFIDKFKEKSIVDPFQDLKESNYRNADEPINPWEK